MLLGSLRTVHHVSVEFISKAVKAESELVQCFKVGSLVSLVDTGQESFTLLLNSYLV